MGIGVIVGVDIIVGIGVGEGDIGVSVGGTDVEAGAHPLNKTVRNTNPKKTDLIVFFMTLISFLIRLCRVAPN